MQLRLYLLALLAATTAVACGGVAECPPGTFAGAGGMCQLSDAGPMCAGDAPFEFEGACVECLLDAQCTTGVCGDDHVCAECADASDCPFDRPVCNDTFECVECLTSVQCGDSARPICADSVCVACNGDPTCLDDALPYCLPDLSACVACAADAACPDGRCEPTAHECVECLGNADCTDGEATFCNASNTCVECLGDGDCTDTESPFCSPSGACVPCLTDSHCTDSASPWCDLDANACVQCLTSDHCGTAEASECGADGSCTLCTQPTSCAHLVDTPQCSGTAAGCVECRPTEGDCGSYSCSPTTFTCTQTPLGSVGLCESCMNGSECATGVCIREGAGAGPGFCFPERATPTSTCPPVYQTHRSALDTTGVSRDYCRQNPVLSCANIQQLYDLLDPTTPTIQCASNSNCVPLNLCRPVSGYSGTVCSIPCTSALDCPAELGGGACETNGSGGKYCTGG